MSKENNRPVPWHAAAGACDTHFHIYNSNWDNVPAMARRAASVGWHAQLPFDGGELATRLSLIEKRSAAAPRRPATVIY